MKQLLIGSLFVSPGGLRFASREGGASDSDRTPQVPVHWSSSGERQAVSLEPSPLHTDDLLALCVPAVVTIFSSVYLPLSITATGGVTLYLS